MTETPAAFDAREFVSRLTSQPGVYRMFGAEGEPLYVGKARNLKKRVSSYFLRASGDPRIESMVDQIRWIEVSITPTEDDALLLEASLIKQLKPRYNVMLRDDKSYPYLKITGNHAYPRIAFYRGAKEKPDRYFGPFASAVAVRETILSLQKLFKLRPCSDNFFANRRRPCLQHQIQRCSAPCVKLIGEADYARDVENAVRLLQGRGEELDRELTQEMEAASTALDFERAARLRDQIAALRRVQEARAVAGGERDVDVFAPAMQAAGSAVTVISVRNGLHLGHRSFFPSHPPETSDADLLSAFLPQYYLERDLPPVILVPVLPAECEWLAGSFSAKAGRRVRIQVPARGAPVRLLEMAQASATEMLQGRLASHASTRARLVELQSVLGLPAPPARLECFDISHTMGEGTVASCVVFNEDGPLKSAYRRFNIEGVAAGDDYAAIRQAVSRRYLRIKQGEAPMPDVLFIDGGKGQLQAALDALAEAGVAPPCIVGVAKGVTRRPGLEQLFVAGRDDALHLPPDSPGLHLIQRIRDEAHRFAITGHRGRREKARITSSLEGIEGLGPARRRALLTTLGGLQQVKRAGVDELAKVEGISRTLAERIYAHFH